MKKVVLLVLLLPLLITGCAFFNSKPSDEQIKNDAYNSKNEQIQDFKIVGINVRGDLARAFVKIRTIYVQDVFGYSFPIGTTNFMSTKPTKDILFNKKGEIREESDTLYYIKTDRSWVKILPSEQAIQGIYWRGH